MQDLITEHIATWTSAEIPKANGGRGRGRGANGQSPHGIKKLRALILELAVRGKLVPQDPNDEPVNVLLGKIAKEKARLIKEGKIKKEKALPKITVDEEPFELPEGWELVRLGNITNRIGSGSTPRGGRSAYVESGIAFLRSQNVWNHGLQLDDVAYISEKTHKIMSNTVVVSRDILLNITGASLGRCAIYPDGLGEANVSQHVTIIRPTEEETRLYLHLCILSPYTQSLVWGRQVGMAREGLSKKVLELFEIPIPPLAEQHRIVAKVDELMDLCDKLEQQQADSNETHQTLVETLLATLTTVADPAEFVLSWKRIMGHFDTLFATEKSIDQLKQTILQLAVMGKLVSQDPNDEPASALLEKIAKEKARLIKEGKIKKQKTLPKNNEGKKPFKLPVGWEWVKLGSLEPYFQNGASSRGDKQGREVVVLRLADISNWRVSLEDTRSLIINEKSIDKYSLEENDILIIRVNGSADIVGRFILCDREIDAVYCDHFIRMRFPVETLAPAYLELLGSSKLIRGSISELFVSTAGQKTVNQKHISSILVTLPPFAEQHRIVAKVDELMAFCDTLKKHLHDAKTTQVQLADAIVEQALVA